MPDVALEDEAAMQLSKDGRAGPPAGTGVVGAGFVAIAVVSLSMVT
jgi:hypothetical protein